MSWSSDGSIALWNDRFAPADVGLAPMPSIADTLRAGGIEDPSAELLAALEARDAAWAARVADSHAAAERRALEAPREGGAKRKAGAAQRMATEVTSAGVYRRAGAERMAVFHCAFDESGSRLACAGGGKEVRRPTRRCLVPRSRAQLFRCAEIRADRARAQGFLGLPVHVYTPTAAAAQ